MNSLRKSYVGIVVLGAMALFALPTLAADWNLDASHSHVGFKVKHMAISKVKGSFGEMAATVTGDPGKPETFSVEVTIQTASVDTGNEKRDEHLRSPEFFDTDKHGAMVFKSTGVKMDGDEGVLMGELTLHGVTRSVELELEYAGLVNDPWGNTRMGFSADGEIDRRDFGLTWSKALETGGLVVGNDVKIELEIEVVQTK